jgi:ESF2/ABP1 family protein
MEISAAKRERDFYLSRVDRAKGDEAMRERREAKARAAEAGAPGAGAAEAGAPGAGAAKAGGAKAGGAKGEGGGKGPAARFGGGGGPPRMQHFGQRRAKDEAPELGRDVLALLAAPGGGKRKRAE